jgi:hypothetical protein
LPSESLPVNLTVYTHRSGERRRRIRMTEKRALPGVLGGIVGVVILESVGGGGGVNRSFPLLLFGLAALAGVAKSGTP